MELTQMEQMLRWLDEERKQDKLLIAALQERLEQQQELILAQARTLEALQQQINGLELELHRTDTYPEMLSRQAQETQGKIEELRDMIRREHSESERIRQSDVQMITDRLVELEARLRVLPRYEEQLKAREAGEARLQGQYQQINATVSDLSKRLEERAQTLVYIEEQRRADTRRITVLEGALPPLGQSIKELERKQTQMEDTLRKLPGRIDEVLQIAKSYEPRIEELRVADFQREQRMKQYADQAEQVKAEVARLVEQTQKYALLYNQNKQALESLESFETRLEKRQAEVAEMQRLTEERFKRQWEEWQANLARDWQKWTLAEEDRWRRRDLEEQRTQARFAELDQMNEFFYRNIADLWDELRASWERWIKGAQETARATSESLTQHAREVRRFAEEENKELL